MILGFNKYSTRKIEIENLTIEVIPRYKISRTTAMGLSQRLKCLRSNK